MKAPSTPIQLIVGLGNPGPDYHHTRHNAGQDFVLRLAQDYATDLSPSPKFFGHSGRLLIGGRDLRLFVPATYMNRSGQAVGAICQFYKIAPENVLVVHDELDLAPGVARLKIGGGHGGHNGLRDVISALANNSNFGRLRIGIGHPGNAKQVVNYVLKRASASDQQRIDAASGAALKAIPDLVEGRWEKAMRELHSSDY